MSYEQRLYDAITSKYVFTSVYDIIDDAIENDTEASYDLLLAYKLCVYIPMIKEYNISETVFKHLSERVYFHMKFVPDDKCTLERAWGFAQAAVIEQYRLESGRSELYFYLVKKALNMLEEVVQGDDLEFHKFGMKCYLNFFSEEGVIVDENIRNYEKFNEFWNRLDSMKNLISVYIKRCIAASLYNYLDIDLLMKLSISFIKSTGFYEYLFRKDFDSYLETIYPLLERGYENYEYCDDYDCEICIFKEQEKKKIEIWDKEREEERWKEENRREDEFFDFGEEYDYNVKEKTRKIKRILNEIISK